MLFLKYVYLAIVALLLVLILTNMFKKDKFLYQLDAAPPTCSKRTSSSTSWTRPWSSSP